MTAIANLPDLRPSLLLDFANSGRVDPRIQCTRASTATCWGPDGKLRTVAANVPRIDYDPATGKCLGLLIEDSRTNFLLQSSDLGAGSWGGSVIDSGEIEIGLQGHAVKGWSKAQSLGNKQQTVAGIPAGGIALSFVAWNKSRRGLVSFAITDSTGAEMRFRASVDSVSGKVTKHHDAVSAFVTAIVAGGKTFVNVSLTIPAGGVRLYLYPGKFDVVDSEITFFDAVQLEVGSSSSSYIATMGASATRAADVVGFTGAASLGTSFTVLQDVALLALPAADNTLGLSVFASDTQRFRFMVSAAGNGYLSHRLSDGPTQNILTETLPVGRQVRSAISSDGQRIGVTSSGRIPTYADASALGLGSSPEIVFSACRRSNIIGVVPSLIRFVAIYNSALSAAQLQRLTV